MIKRRSFLKTAGLVAAGTLIAPGYNFTVKKRRRVVVLGAGLAGLSAAYRLQQLGFGVDVVEYQGRIGGRVLTYKPDPDEKFTVEMGGEWIGNSHKSILKLIQELGLQTEAHTFDAHLLYRGDHKRPGNWDFSANAKNALREVIEKYQILEKHKRQEFDAMDWWRYLRNNGYDTRDLDLQDLIDSVSLGEGIRQTSALRSMRMYESYGPTNEMDLRISGGNDALCRALADKIGYQNIHLNQQVIRVKQDPGGVSAFSFNGNIYEGDKLVCALPVLAIRRIAWEPEFPVNRREALNSLQYGRVTKTAFLFKNRFWQDDNFSLLSDETPHYLYHATRGQEGTHGVLMSQAAGDRAALMGGFDAKKRINTLSDTLNPIFGEVKSSFIKQNAYDWGRDSITMGSVALYRPGQWLETLPLLRKEQHNIHFAGEHLGEWQGYMDGAVQSGIEAADQIAGR
jgi:monoamine oxidase